MVAPDLDEVGRGDPAFDVAHFLADLKLLGLQLRGCPTAYEDTALQYRAGYAETGSWPGDDGVLAAFAWCKLAYRLIRWQGPARDVEYALAAGRRALS